MPTLADKYIWTEHSRFKLRQYRLSEPRIKRIIRHPSRIEEGILEGAIACMQPSGSKKYSEIWTLYVLSGRQQRKIKVISAWRYPGKAPERDPIPEHILNEIRELI